MVHDPDRLALHKGLRAGLAVPVTYGVVGGAIGGTASLFAAFACFSALVFADFQGPVRRRLGGYGFLLVGGAALVVLAGAVADSLPAAVVTVFVVAFVLRFVGCLGGYATVAGTTLMTAFALAVMATPVEEMDQRVAGWAIGVLVATAVAVLTTARYRYPARHNLAEHARMLATDLRELAAGRHPDPRSGLEGIANARIELERSVARPLNSSAHQRALTGLLDGLGRATLVVERLDPVAAEDVAEQQLGAVDTSSDCRQLAALAADTFEAAARALVEGDAVDLGTVHHELTAHRRRLIQALATEDPAVRWDVERHAAATIGYRLAASLAAVTAADAAVVAGHLPAGGTRPLLDVEVEIPRPGARAFVGRTLAILGFHLRWTSTRLRNSLRAGVALAAALTIARAWEFDHGFWVLLGTLMVLRSGAVDTTASAVDALKGVGVGFVLAAPLAYFFAGDDTVLWVVLPIATFVAAWAPAAIGLGTGQAAFTVFVVVLFNLFTPQGAQTALVRLETVAVGVAVAAVAGVLFWPRGPEATIGAVAARYYRAAGAMVAAITAEVLDLPGSPRALDRARHELLATRAQLNETLQELTSDRRTVVDLSTRVALLTPPAVVLAGDWTRRTFWVDDPADVGRTGPLTGNVPSADDIPPALGPLTLEARTFEVEARLGLVADQLEDPGCIVRPLGEAGPVALPDPTGVDARVLLSWIWLRAWLDLLERSVEHTAPASVQLVRDLPRRWWQREGPPPAEVESPDAATV
nr:FUSC family protein [Rhabdothermincola salaria]